MAGPNDVRDAAFRKVIHAVPVATVVDACNDRWNPIIHVAAQPAGAAMLLPWSERFVMKTFLKKTCAQHDSLGSSDAPDVSEVMA